MNNIINHYLKNKGLFICFEGGEGSGKTSQIKLISEILKKHNIPFILTREPGGTQLGIALRKLLLNPPAEKSPEPLTELFLYAADRAQHVSQLILPALERGDWVLSDRFSGSTLAYQGYGRNLNLEVILLIAF